MSFNQKIDKPTITGPLGQTIDAVMAGAQVNQIRGVNVANNIGSGIPKQVTDVSASVKNATTGSTNVVKVTFRRDPTDVSFSKAQVYLRGYNGNNANVLVASGADSPISFVLNNTGESVVVLVQSSGNAGDAPISSSPTTGVKLPLSAGGGYSSTSVTSSTTGLTGDVVTSGSSSPLTATVVGLESVPLSNSAPHTGDVIRYNEYGDSKWDVTSFMSNFVYCGVNAGSTTHSVVPGTNGDTVLGNVTVLNGSATEPHGITHTAVAATASLNPVVGYQTGSGNSANRAFSWGTARRFTARMRFNGTSNTRYWVGLVDASVIPGVATMATDTPNQNFAGFRFSATTDSVYKAVTCTSTANITATSTGVAVDTTNSQLLEFVHSGSSVFFLINGNLVATNTTNLMADATNLHMIFTGDNKNTNTSVSTDFFWMSLTFK